ncbi:MAG: pyridoxal-dependent decarboxylase, partial [Chloroflexota bacterium]
SVDPLPQILELRDKYGFRVHADAAYGGYFVLADGLPDHTTYALRQLGAADSIAIDPHKHGLQPYGCGCILFKDPSVGSLYKHDSPYTYFTSSELHLGEISLECSRAGASAVALWATQQLLPLVKDGEFAQSLSKCRRAAQMLYQRLASDHRFLPLFEPELDIVAWAPRAPTTRKVSALSRALFQAAARHDLHLALFSYPTRLLRESWQGVDLDEDNVTCLRSCLMKPEHLAWMDRIWQLLDQAMDEVSSRET